MDKDTREVAEILMIQYEAVRLKKGHKFFSKSERNKMIEELVSKIGDSSLLEYICHDGNTITFKSKNSREVSYTPAICSVTT
jgi:hypothetical protein